MTEQQIIATMCAEIVAKPSPMELVLRPSSAFHLTGVVQLALRHPNLPDSSREIGEQFLAAVREYFFDCPTVLDIIRRGDDPAEDLPRGQKVGV